MANSWFRMYAEFATDPKVILHASAAADMVGNGCRIKSSGGGFTVGRAATVYQGSGGIWDYSAEI
jgi:hypothetical protein